MVIPGYTCESSYEHKEKYVIETKKFKNSDYNFKDNIYISLDNSDNFKGLIVPKEFEYIIEIVYNNSDLIDCIFDDYEEYRDYEVEVASQARHGSNGSEKLDNKQEILEFFDNYSSGELEKLLKELM